MSSVIYNASEGYDESLWDDSALIKAYEAATESGRELQRSRGAGARRGARRVWELGQACRAVYSVDGEEYEGTVAHKNVGNKSVTVRFHGYNNEEEVRVSELMESQGAEAVAEQVEEAGLEEEEEEEEPGAGEDFRPGDWCRAEWTQDGVVYEAVIESMNKKKGTARVRYLGFNNQEEKELEELYLSKGEEWRGEQERRGAEGGIREDEIHNLIAQNCPDLLANFGGEGEGDAAGLDLDKLTIQPKSKQKKPKKKEPSADRSLHEALTSEFSENQVAVETLDGGDGKKAKGKKTKETKERSSKKPPKPSVPTSLPASWDLPPSYSQPPMGPFPGPMYPPAPMMPPMASHMMPPMASHMMPPMFPSASPMMPPMFPQQMQPPVGIPPPPVLEGMMEDEQGLHSLLLSWYMAGYHAGLYQQARPARPAKLAKKKTGKE